MFCHSAKTAIDLLTAHATDRHGPVSEAEYFAACARQEALLHRPSPAKAARAILAALTATRFGQWVATGTARRQNAAGMDVLLRGDARLLRDLGISATPFGGYVLDQAWSGQSADLTPEAPEGLPTLAGAAADAMARLAPQIASRGAPQPAGVMA